MRCLLDCRFHGCATVARSVVLAGDSPKFPHHGGGFAQWAAAGGGLARFAAEPADHPRRILEVGPGTGAVTRCLVNALGPQDRLDLVERNDSFVACLGRRLQTEPAFQAVADRVSVLHCPGGGVAAGSEVPTGGVRPAVEQFRRRRRAAASVADDGPAGAGRDALPSSSISRCGG